MNTNKIRGKYCGVGNIVRPAAVGILLSGLVTAGLIAAFSLLFVLLESIAESAIVPLALISAALGCFAGAFLCSSMVNGKCVLFGLAIGLVMFVLIFVIGIISSDVLFGTETAIKLVLLLIAGGAGGYCGGRSRYRRRK